MSKYVRQYRIFSSATSMKTKSLSCKRIRKGGKGIRGEGEIGGRE